MLSTEVLRAGDVRDAADDLLTAIGKPGHEVLVRLGHAYTLPPFTKA